MRLSQLITFLIGVVAILLAWQMNEVLSLMLYSYAFMVSGLLVPVVAGLFFGKRNGKAAVTSMILGGSITAILTFLDLEMPLGLDPNLYGLTASLVAFIAIDKIDTNVHPEIINKEYDKA
jgi:SSS family solute:Na+ symporter